MLAKKTEQSDDRWNVCYMSTVALPMTTKDPVFAFAKLFDRVGSKALEDSEIERYVLALFDEHRMRLVRYVLSIGLSVHDGEEIVQDAFLALFRHLQLGRPRDNLRGWLFRVAHNLALKRRQFTQSRPDQAELDDAVAGQHADPSPGPEQQLAFSQRKRHLLACVQALPPRDQYCLHLRAEGLGYREIAEILDISLGSVSNSLSRSIARLEKADRE
jgi:RNA polymerase sigma-70 factor, ECF subfamily